MGEVETVFVAPLIFRILCYLSGMAVFLAVNFWLIRRAYGYENLYSLRGTVGRWLVRILMACSVWSLIHIGFGIPILRTAIPEIVILSLGMAVFFFVTKQPLQRLPEEVFKILGVSLASALAWVIIAVLVAAVFKSIQFMGAPLWMPIFMVGLVLNAPLVLFYRYADQGGRLEGLKFHQLLWPILLAYIWLMLPDIAEHLGNNPKIHEMMNASPPLRRV